jgi:hypothetical protein
VRGRKKKILREMMIFKEGRRGQDQGIEKEKD